MSEDFDTKTNKNNETKLKQIMWSQNLDWKTRLGLGLLQRCTNLKLLQAEKLTKDKTQTKHLFRRLGVLSSIVFKMLLSK